MSPARSPPRANRACEDTAVRLRGVLGAARSGLRGGSRPASRRRARSRGSRRKSYRPHLHRGSKRRLALRGASPLRVLELTVLDRARRRPASARRVHQRRGPLRSARQQAHHRGDESLPQLSDARDRSSRGGSSGRGPRAHRVRRFSCGLARARTGNRQTEAEVLSRLGARSAVLGHSSRELSPEPAEHVHRQADPPHASRRLPPRAGPHSWRHCAPIEAQLDYGIHPNAEPRP